jgi:DNA-binding Lrp family transcriptional regulator
MVKRGVLIKLIDQKKAAILQVITNSKEEMYLKEIAEKSNVSITSTFRILKELVELDILAKKEWKTSKVYYCQKNAKVDFLKDIFTETYDGLNEFVNLVKDFPEVENIILHGAKKKSKANLLLIGQDIDGNKVEDACKQVRDKGFDLSYLTLTKSQYAQMAKMGLYSGEKKVL